MKSSNRFFFSFFILVVLFPGCLSHQGRQPVGNAKPKVIRLAYQLGHLPDIIAKNRHLFEDEFKDDSIAIEFKKFDFGPPEIEAFGAGKLDVGSIGDQPAIIGWAKGIDIKIVGNILGSEDIMSLLVPENSPITSFEQLKGKKIGVTIGSNIQHLFNLYLKKAGFRETDVQVVNLQFSDCVTALSLHQIDATLLSEPYISMATYKFKAKVIANSKGLKYVTLPYIASGEFIKAHPDLVRRILSVYRKASVWAAEHKEEAADILFKEENGLLPREVDVPLIDKYTENFGLNEKTFQAFTETYQYLKDIGVIRNHPDISTLYTTEFDKQ